MPKSTKSGIKTPKDDLSIQTKGTGELAFDATAGKLLNPDQSAQAKMMQETGSTFSKKGKGEVTGEKVAANLMNEGATAAEDYNLSQQKATGMIPQAWKNMSELTDPNLDKVYDHAFADTERKLTRAAMARGRMSSSDTMRNIREAAVDIEDKQAVAEATYKLDRAKAMGDLATSGTSTMSDLAFKAGDQKLSYQQGAANVARDAQALATDRAASGFAAALGMDADELDTTTAGLDAAIAAQTARETRIDTGLTHDEHLADAMYGAYSDTNKQDKESGDTQISTKLAAEEEKRRADEAQAEANRQAGLDMMEAGAQLKGSDFTGGAANSYTGGGPGSGAGGTYNMGGGPTRGAAR